MQSTSAYDGTYTLTVSFEIGSDPNMDQVLVQNRVQNAMAQLPQSVQTQGVSIRAKSASILEFVTLDSPAVGTTPSICGTTRRSTWSTSCRGCRASAT
jgi:HAE1 family hydrophobic/amphiphilic exporter-1